MSLTKPSREKLFITRARLWANVYWSICDANKQAGPNQVLGNPEKESDKAIKAFDFRFNGETFKESNTNEKPVLGP